MTASLTGTSARTATSIPASFDLCVARASVDPGEVDHVRLGIARSGDLRLLVTRAVETRVARVVLVVDAQTAQAPGELCPLRTKGVHAVTGKPNHRESHVAVR